MLTWAMAHYFLTFLLVAYAMFLVSIAVQLVIRSIIESRRDARRIRLVQAGVIPAAMGKNCTEKRQ